MGISNCYARKTEISNSVAVIYDVRGIPAGHAPEQVKQNSRKHQAPPEMWGKGMPCERTFAGLLEMRD